MIRTLARSLTQHALDVMPPERRPWALGMAAELDHIEDDGAALAFALGAVMTSYRHGARVWSNWLRLGRWGVGLSTVVLGALVMLFATGLHPVQAGVNPPTALSLPVAALALCFLCAGWSFIRRRTMPFVLSLLAGATLVIIAAAIFPTAGVAARAAPFYRALLLEEAFSLLALTAWGMLFWRLERRTAPA